jgi:RNA polymerase sigma-70 factor (ECF subfamily)
LLLLGARLRDEVALTALYDRYAALIFTLALRVVGERPRAETVMQDVFLRCWRGQDQYDAAHGTPATWLLGMALEFALESRRVRQSGADSAEVAAADALPSANARDEAPESAEVEPGAPALPAEVATRERVGRAVADLAELERSTIELAYYGGLTQTEIATQLGEPLAVVEDSVRDGLARLRRALNLESGDGTVGSDGAE